MPMGVRPRLSARMRELGEAIARGGDQATIAEQASDLVLRGVEERDLPVGSGPALEVTIGP